MLGDRRVVVFAHIERLFKGRKKAVEAEDEGAEDVPPPDPGGLEGYVGQPEPSNVLVLVATDINRSTRLGKVLDKQAVTVECEGFSSDGFNGAQSALREAMQFAADRFKAAGKRIDAAGLTALVERAGPDIVRLRKDVETLVLFAGDAPAVTEKDVRLVVGAAQQFDDWAVTNAIAAGDAPAALRHVQLMVENGSSPFQMLGQLGWWVRTKMTQVAPDRVGAAVRALFRADAESKLGRDPQVVLERLVVELCGPAAPAGRGEAGGRLRREAVEPLGDPRLVTRGRVVVDDTLLGHLVDQRHRFVQPCLGASRVVRADGLANRLERRTQTGPGLPVPIAIGHALLVRLQRRLVICHETTPLCLRAGHGPADGAPTVPGARATRPVETPKYSTSRSAPRATRSLPSQALPFRRRSSRRSRLSGATTGPRGRVSLRSCRNASSSGVGGGVMSS